MSARVGMYRQERDKNNGGKKDALDYQAEKLKEAKEMVKQIDKLRLQEERK